MGRRCLIDPHRPSSLLYCVFEEANVQQNHLTLLRSDGCIDRPFLVEVSERSHIGVAVPPSQISLETEKNNLSYIDLILRSTLYTIRH